MSRSWYSDECDGWQLICWRGAVASAIRGKRGQAMLRELRDALDSMPEKRLIKNELVTREGDVCALGRLAQVRNLDVSGVDPEDREHVAKQFGIAEALAAEIVYENDEGSYCSETPQQRWQRVRRWVERQIIEPDKAKGAAV